MAPSRTRPCVAVRIHSGCRAVRCDNRDRSWVINEACRQAARWPTNLYVSINVSPVQLCSVDMLRQITFALTEHQLTPQRIEVEITETAVVENCEQVAIAFRALL
nr:EAL domain-containing protein [Bradyrhizobium pachyrhizi]